MQRDLPAGQSTAARLLVIDTDPLTADNLSQAFASRDLTIERSTRGREALAELATGRFDFILLDLDLPDIEGIDLLRLIRSRWSTPVIIVTARPARLESVLSLELGADDYVTKPADPHELKARVRAVLRRGQPATTTISGFMEDALVPSGKLVEFDGWQFDTTSADLWAPDGGRVHVTTMEAALLRFLVSRPRVTLKRSVINAHVHGDGQACDDRSVDVLVKKLRAKLEEHSPNLVAIRSIRGVGYMFGLDVRRVKLDEPRG